MNYWLDLFTGTTWKQFRDAGANVSGFRERMRKPASRVKQGDIFLCYLTGVMRWVGALEVIGLSSDARPIWTEGDFPVRLNVKPLILLEPENGVPMTDLEGRVGFYSSPRDYGGFKGFIRMSPNLFRAKTDGEFVLNLLKRAQTNPVSRPVDPKKLARKALYRAERRKGKATVSTVVSVPEPDEPEELQAKRRTEEAAPTTRHTEIQHALGPRHRTPYHETIAPKSGKAKRSVNCPNLLTNCLRSSTN